MKSATKALLVLLLGCFSIAHADGLEETWRKSQAELKSDSPSSAIALLSNWVQTADPLGIHSPEAHYNLAAALWKNKEGGDAVFHLVQAARLRSSPVQSWKDLDLLSEMQYSLGVQEPVSQNTLWRLSQIFSSKTLFALIPIPMWFVIAAGFLGFWFGKQSLRDYLLLAGTVPALLIAILFLISLRQPKSEVIVGAEEGVSLFKEAKASDTSKIIELPTGTLVSVSEESNGFVQIQEPVSGWIEATHLKPL